MASSSSQVQQQSQGSLPTVYVWIVILNRDISKQEYENCVRCLELNRAVDRPIEFPSDPNRTVAWRHVISRMLPLIMMTHRKVTRRHWDFNATSAGKEYITMDYGPSPSPNVVRKVMAYSLVDTMPFVAFAFAHGRKQDVVNIGVAACKTWASSDVPVAQYVASVAHKLTEQELQNLPAPHPNGEMDEIITRRVAIMLTLKDAYIRALGQPLGFDYSRLEVDVPNQRLYVDGARSIGWEFQIFKVHVAFVDESYHMATAVWRGNDRETRFVWLENKRELAEVLQFITADQIVTVPQKLIP